MKLHRPESLAAVMALVLEWAETQADRGQQQLPTSNPRRSWQNRENRGPSGPGPNQQPIQSTSGQPANRGPDQPRSGTIRVSQAEKADRTCRGLCYYCLEKWVIGHVCKQRLLCYFDEEENGEEDVLAEFNAEEPVGADISHIHASDRGRRSRPLKVVGTIQKREVSVLIDKGSDWDFLHPEIAESLHLPQSPIRPFRVYVGNGEALLCSHVSKQTKLEVQGSVFLVDLHILPIHDPDVVLGMDWLESLGKITALCGQNTTV